MLKFHEGEYDEALDYLGQAAIGMDARWAYPSVPIQAAGVAPPSRAGESGGSPNANVLGSTWAENVYLIDHREHRVKLNGFVLLPRELTLAWSGVWVRAWTRAKKAGSVPWIATP